MSKQSEQEQIKKLDELKSKTSNEKLKASINEKQKYINKPIRK